MFFEENDEKTFMKKENNHSFQESSEIELDLDGAQAFSEEIPTITTLLQRKKFGKVRPAPNTQDIPKSEVRHSVQSHTPPLFNKQVPLQTLDAKDYFNKMHNANSLNQRRLWTLDYLNTKGFFHISLLRKTLGMQAIQVLRYTAESALPLQSINMTCASLFAAIEHHKRNFFPFSLTQAQKLGLMELDNSNAYPHSDFETGFVFPILEQQGVLGFWIGYSRTQVSFDAEEQEELKKIFSLFKFF